MLRPVVANVKLLASLGFPSEDTMICQLRSPKVNYLTCLEYLSDFDYLFKEHLSKSQCSGPPKTNILGT
jgi:hypothetical protein